MIEVTRVVLFATMVSICATAASAGEIVFEKNKVAKPSGFTLVEDSVRGKIPSLKINAHVSKLVANEVTTKDGTFTDMQIPGMQVGGNVGDPALPVMTRLVEVPHGAKVSVKVTGREVQKIALSDLQVKAPIKPRQPPQPKDDTVVPFAHNPQAYTAPGFQQETLATVEEVGMMRDHRLVLVKVAPVAYEPTTGKLEVFTDVQVDVSLEGADLNATKKARQTHGSPYFDWANRNTLVPESLKADPINRPTSYLIIADRQFEAELKPFIAWKTEKGFIVNTAYTDQIGNTAVKVKEHIAAAYANATAEAPAPDFVLFVGDNEQIPAFRGTAGSHITDLPFSAINGNDDIPDIFTGRFSAQNAADLKAQVDKTIYYEKAQFADPSFAKSAVLIAGWDSRFAVEWGWPQINYALKYFFNATTGFDNVYFSLTKASGQNMAQIVEKVSVGVAFYNYTAHGSQTDFSDPRFSIANINAMKNEGKYPLVVGNCCLTNSFQVGTCFGEAWLRAPSKGAIGYIGGSNSTYWDEDLWWGNGNYAIQHPNPEGLAPTTEQTGVGGYEGVFNGTYSTQGAMNVCGNLAVQESTSPRKKYYWEVYHLMGDPSLKPFFGNIKEETVTHDGTVAAGATSVTVAAPVGSYVGITADGALVGAAHVTAAKATIPTKPLVAGQTLKVVVSGQNLKTYTGTLTVGEATPPQPTPPQGGK